MKFLQQLKAIDQANKRQAVLPCLKPQRLQQMLQQLHARGH